MKPEDVPELPGYLGLVRAAARMGVSRQVLYYRMWQTSQFDDAIFQIPGQEGARPGYVLKLEAVEKAVAAEQARAARKAEQGPRQLINERNKRIKIWGHESGWPGPIHVAGGPSKDLITAYEKSHPEDVLS